MNVALPVVEIQQALTGAAGYTAYHLAQDYIHYMLLRFSEPKHGRMYYAPGRGWYRASAPGEYPAIKYGILYRSLSITTPVRVSQTGMLVHVGALPFPGQSYGVRDNDPDYARELEGLEGNGPTRPYFQRARLATSFTRERDALAHFLTFLYERGSSRVNPINGQPPANLNLALGSITFASISRRMRSRNVQVTTVNI